MPGLPMTNITTAPGRRWSRIRRSIAAGSSIPDRTDNECSYLVEAGVIAVSITLDRTPSTCVELLGPGTLIGFQTDLAVIGSTYRAVSPTELLEIPADLLRQAMRRHSGLRETYLRQLRDRIAQTKLVAACNAHHSLPERCARWLHRLHAHLGPVLPVTHAFLATMLGVRRAGISVTLESLQREGLIRQRRGSIEVLDGVALRHHACPCPDGVAGPACAISADLIEGNVVDLGGPRIRLERAAMQNSGPVLGDKAWERREAALRLCRTIVAQGLAFLEQ
jgi:CRP-like cAMP-binding protein